VHGEASAALYRKIAHDLTATYSEVVDDPYAYMVARECSGEFHLVANVLPLVRHIGALKGIRFKSGFCDETPLIVLSPQERLVGEEVVVKGIEIFRNFKSA